MSKQYFYTEISVQLIKRTQCTSPLAFNPSLTTTTTPPPPILAHQRQAVSRTVMVECLTKMNVTSNTNFVWKTELEKDASSLIYLLHASSYICSTWFPSSVHLIIKSLIYCFWILLYGN